MVPAFWKLSHGQEHFKFEELLDAMNSRLVYIHRNSPPMGGSASSQGDLFVNAPIGDYFYLSHGNQGIYFLGQFSGPANLFSEFGEGWLDRPYRLIKSSIARNTYDGLDKWWAPNHNSTFTKVPESELLLFEKQILEPFFEITLADYGIRL